MNNMLRKIYDNMTFGTVLTISTVFSILFLLSSIALHHTEYELKQQTEQIRLEKCEKACYPNGVYECNSNRCMCNVQVIVKDIQ